VLNKSKPTTKPAGPAQRFSLHSLANTLSDLSEGVSNPKLQDYREIPLSNGLFEKHFPAHAIGDTALPNAPSRSRNVAKSRRLPQSLQANRIRHRQNIGQQLNLNVWLLEQILQN
jgi:hypothetical protein